jgi:hypothetical protein
MTTDRDEHDNPIMELARAINDAPPVAEAPFTLTPPPDAPEVTNQPGLFEGVEKDDTR